MYWYKTPQWVPFFFPQCVWKMPKNTQKIFLTFDDGPHPDITPWVLNELKKHQAKATFFLLGKQVQRYPELVNDIIQSGHSVGNHSFSHQNGWHVDAKNYLNDIDKADNLLSELVSDAALKANNFSKKLFRPPYGKLTFSQMKQLRKDFSIVMWDVLSGDFNHQLTAEICWQHCLQNIQEGSIIVFHDTPKAELRLKYCLPRLLEKYSLKGNTFEAL